MKKSSILTTLTFAFTLLFSVNMNAQKFPDLDKSPMDAASYPSDYKNSEKEIKIIYSRPQLKGRTLETLVPAGKVWRAGANEAAEITLYSDMMVGDAKVPAGTYTFYLMPGDDEWTAILSKDLNVWGSYFYDEANDIARIKVPVKQDKESLEAFSIMFDESDNGIDMYLGWDKSRVVVPFTKA